MMAEVVRAYRALVEKGEIEADPVQAHVAGRLDALADELARMQTRRGGLFGSLKTQRPARPRGLYIHGAVGRGKTMLMDLFYVCVRQPSKRRIHFHEFMAEAHERISRGRATTDGDPIPFVAGEIAAEAGLLCLDELQVTDIADAMILSRLFSGLFDKGTIVVATSNTAPERLYWNGLNRQLFLPFIALLGEHADAIELASAKDFRLDKLSGRPLYFTPDDEAARCALDSHWERLTGHHPAVPLDLEVKGRKVHVPLSAMGVARFGFADLCGQPLGALDYLHICHAFHTVLIDGIPVLAPSHRNEARRLVTLIDTLYDNRVCLIASAAAEPDCLYPEGDGAELFERTVSRLMEMRSEAYLAGRQS
jgi:cell division protein ZapE